MEAYSSSPLSSAPSFLASSDSELSELEHSPSPPPEDLRTVYVLQSYPSPTESQRASREASRVHETMASTPPASDNDGGPPHKKRKLSTDPKQRSTEYLDLTRDITGEDKPQLERLLKALHKKKKIVVIAGAGISVSAGIPDFRSSSGLFSTLKKEHKLKSSGKDLFDASVYQDDSSTSSFHDMVRSLSQKTKTAQPTAFHHLLATLAQEGRLMRLYTQNVDGIDTSLPPLKTQVPLPKKGPWPKTVQLHGGLEKMVCSKCQQISDFDAEQFDGPIPPACEECTTNDHVRQVAEKRSHGIGRLRPRMVLYNEHNPDDEAIGSCASLDLRTRPDAVIVAGTTLKVPGVRRIAREMCAIVRDRRDGVSIWINNDPEPIGKDLANSWDIVVKGPCDEVARRAAMLKWDDPIRYKVVTDEEVLKMKVKQKAEVIVSSSPRKLTALERMQAPPTPAQSPRLNPRTTIKSEPSEPSTPSKKGTKRNLSDAKMGKNPAKPPAKRLQTQPKKAPGAKGKGKKTTNPNQKIDSILRAKKPSTAATQFISSKYNKAEQLPVAKENLGTIEVLPITPSKSSRGQGAQVTKYKPMVDVSSADLNSPKRPEMEPFTSPVRPRSPIESRPSSASSWKSEIQHLANNNVPKGMRDLLH